LVRISVALREPIPVREDVAGTSESYSAGEEKTKVSITGTGQVTTWVRGDGDAGVIMRFYVDGTLVADDNSPSNEPAVVEHKFTSSFEIRAYAPTAGTYKFSTINVAGWRK
jgi:hypothetical protein